MESRKEKISRLQDILEEAKGIVNDLENYVSELSLLATTKDFENVNVQSVNFGSANNRVQNVLSRGKVETMGQLYRMGRFGFMRVRTAGIYTADVIKEKFKELYDVDWE